MTAWEWVRVTGILGPIVFMIFLGFSLTLRSGVAHLATPAGMRRALENGSEAFILLLGCLIGLVVIHQLVGHRVGGIW
jgi:hypothetical protein